ncbi:hypothetical protein DIPPA_24160 [Diplonema papillatum]|nr:hypothetical protein DIPPA_24160 [Diplonema papillatum]
MRYTNEPSGARNVLRRLSKYASSDSVDSGVRDFGVELAASDARLNVQFVRSLPCKKTQFLGLEYLSFDLGPDSFLFIPNFSQAWALRRTTDEYDRFFKKLTDAHVHFLGTRHELSALLPVIARKVKACMHANDLDVPPWRTAQSWQEVCCNRKPCTVDIELLGQSAEETSTQRESDDDLASADEA